MKLTIKEIAPYLPYELEAQSKDNETKVIQWYIETYTTTSVGLNFILIDQEPFFKPLLRPLSEINGSIKHNGQTIHVLGEMTGFEIETYRKWKDSEIYRDDIKIHISADLFLKLVSWHFDVFGLIEKGLAIKKQTK